MSDGNTGIHVTPVTKEEAVNLQSMFSKVAQALVDASNYPEQVKALQERVNQLESNLQSKTTHAEELDKSLAEVRQQRDDSRRENSELSSQLRTTQRDLESANRTIESHASTIQVLQADLSKARHDRDDYGLQVLSLEDQVKAWKEKAEKARVRLNDVLSVFKQEEPEPEPIPAFIQPKEPEASPNPTAETTNSTGPNTGQASAEPEPSPSASPPSYASSEPQQDRNYDPGEPPHPVFDSPNAPQPSHPVQATEEGPRYLENWEPGAIWDSAAGKYRLDH